MSAPPSPPRGRRAAGSERAVLLLAAAGGAVLALAAGVPVWLRGAVAGPTGLLAITADGREAAPGVAACALVALAAVVACALARSAARWVAAAVLLLAGCGTALAAGATALAPEQALAPVARQASGLAGAPPATAAEVTAWPWVAAAGGAVTATAGALVLLRGRGWPASARHEREAAPVAGAAGAAEDPAAAWDSLSRGDDPTR